MKIIGNIDKNKDWIDFSSLNMLMKCPRSYYWRIVKEITTSAPAIALINGKAYHDGKAAYYESKMAGISHEDSIDVGLKALAIGMKDIKVEDPTRNLTIAVQTLSNYFELWKDEPWVSVDVELSMAVDLINFIFVGRVDRIVESTTGLGRFLEETKTTSIIGERWGMRGRPNMQIDGYYSMYYMLTGELLTGGVLDIIPVKDKPYDRKNQPFRIMTMRNQQDIEDWMSNIQEWWFTLQRYKETGIYPQNTEACVPMVGYTCSYTTLCSMFPHPYKMKEIPIPGEYMQELWAPFEELKKEEKKC